VSAIELRSVEKDFGAVKVIRGVDLSIDTGEFVVFVGPSGCGKSTLLRMIAGLEALTHGEIWVGGRRADQLMPYARGIAMVFQSYALYPHMTVRKNLAFGLENIGASQSEIDRRLAYASQVLQIEHLLDRRPNQLSGGQSQRVAIGRAIVKEPKAFLLDEPLSNLDAELRVRMRSELVELHRRLKSTMIFVTHDQVEAMTMADRIVVLKDGQIQQVGSPVELYARPANQFVAGFLGAPAMNFIPAGREGPRSVRPNNSAVVLSFDDISEEDLGLTATVGVRPEHLRLDPEGLYELKVRASEILGSETILICEDAGGRTVMLAEKGVVDVRQDEVIRSSMNPSFVHLFKEDGTTIVRGSGWRDAYVRSAAGITNTMREFEKAGR
jgi:multiple sugar transport system ATP-binding protein